MNSSTQALTLTCRHFAMECNDAEIAKLKKQKSRAHYATYTLRKENARLRNELFSCQRALGRQRQCIDHMQSVINKCTKDIMLILGK